MLGSLGLPEILFILALALLVFGPKRLPQVGRTLGRALNEFRRATTDLKRSVNRELSADFDEKEDEEDGSLAPSKPPHSASRSPEPAATQENETEPDIESAPAPDSPVARTELPAED